MGAIPVRTEDLVQLLLDHGFVPGQRQAAGTDFTHAGGAVVTVPTGAAQVPLAFVRVLAQQFAIMDLPGTDELTRLLAG